MTAPNHHPSDALLVAYASGSLGERLAMVVATHLAFCPPCRARNAVAETLGGQLLEALEPAAMGAASLASIMARLDDAAPWPARRALAGTWPEPLAATLAEDGPVAWRRIGPGLRQHVIAGGAAGRGGTLRLLKTNPGAAVPPHEHGGLELTLVLRGAFRDGSEVFRQGDLQEVDDDAMHRPRTLPGEDCICLVANERPLRLTRRIDRLIQYVLRA